MIAPDSAHGIAVGKKQHQVQVRNGMAAEQANMSWATDSAGRTIVYLLRAPTTLPAR